MVNSPLIWPYFLGGGGIGGVPLGSHDSMYSDYIINPNEKTATGPTYNIVNKNRSRMTKKPGAPRKIKSDLLKKLEFLMKTQ